jgi:hypothetical protein
MATRPSAKVVIKRPPLGDISCHPRHADRPGWRDKRPRQYARGADRNSLAVGIHAWRPGYRGDGSWICAIAAMPKSVPASIPTPSATKHRDSPSAMAWTDTAGHHLNPAFDRMMFDYEDSRNAAVGTLCPLLNNRSTAMSGSSIDQCVGGSAWTHCVPIPPLIRCCGSNVKPRLDRINACVGN